MRCTISDSRHNLNIQHVHTYIAQHVLHMAYPMMPMYVYVSPSRLCHKKNKKKKNIYVPGIEFQAHDDGMALVLVRRFGTAFGQSGEQGLRTRKDEPWVREGRSIRQKKRKTARMYRSDKESGGYNKSEDVMHGGDRGVSSLAIVASRRSHEEDGEEELACKKEPVSSVLCRGAYR